MGDSIERVARAAPATGAVTQGGPRRAAPQAFAKASRGLASLVAVGSPARRERIAALALAWGAGALLVLSDLLTLYSIDVAGTSCEALANPGLADTCSTAGGEQHGYAFVVVGLLVLLMGYGAAVGQSRPAAFALVGCGAVVLALALARDLPDSRQVGPIGPNFDPARAVPGPGLWTALTGGALAVLAGAVALRRPRR